jgi:hypothetical protein
MILPVTENKGEVSFEDVTRYQGSRLRRRDIVADDISGFHTGACMTAKQGKARPHSCRLMIEDYDTGIHSM